MTRRKHGQTLMFTAVLSCAVLHIGCKAEEAPSAVIGGYTISRDFDGDRRVLRIEPSSEQPAECMETSLPASTTAPWKEAMLDPELHYALIDMMRDADRVPVYEADTEASLAAEVFVCMDRADGPEFCYVPRVVVVGADAPWRFGLQPEVTLSSASQELIDEFLSAHDACWNARTAMGAGN